MYGCSVSCTNSECQCSTLTYVDRIEERSLNRAFMKPFIVGYEPADITVHPPPPELPRVGSFFSYRCLVFPKKCPQMKT